MRHSSLMLMCLALMTWPAWAQSPQPAPSRVPVSPPLGAPRVEVPRELTLDRAEDILLQNNLAVIASRYNVDVARAQRFIASLRPNPTLTLGHEQFDFEHSIYNGPQTLVTFRVDQLIERGRKRELRTEAAEFALQASEAQVLDAVRTQLFQLRQAFSNAILARENLRVATENLNTINDTERLIKLQVDAGAVAEGDLIRFQANKVQFQRDLVAARLAYEQAVRDVLNLMGSQASNVVPEGPGPGTPAVPAYLADTPVYIVGGLQTEAVMPPVEELRDAAAQNRPDVLAAKRNVNAARRALDLAHALRTRDVSVGTEFQRASGFNTVGLVVSFPIFLWNNFQGDIDRAQAQLKQTNALLAQVQLAAITDVDKAYQAFQLSQQTLRVYTSEALARAEQSFRIAQTAYREGATSLLELLDAQRTLNQTRVAANQAQFDHRVSIYQLEQAIGRPIVKP